MKPASKLRILLLRSAVVLSLLLQTGLLFIFVSTHIAPPHTVLPAPAALTAHARLPPAPALHNTASVTIRTLPPPRRSHPSLPPPLRHLHPLSPRDPRLARLTAHPFTSPAVLTSYLRPSLHPPAAYDLFLFTSALFRRNLTATHCVLSTHTLLPVISHVDDVVYCRLHHLPREGATLSVALLRDPALEASLAGPVPIATGYNTTLRHGDIISPTTNSPPILRSFVSYARARVDPVKPPLPHARTRPPRYRLCVATMSRVATYMLPDWVAHHRRLGVDHVFIFDNGVQPPLAHGPLGRRPDVEVLTWPWAKSQLAAFSFALLAARGRCERLLKMDSDEFVLLGLGNKTEAWGNRRRPLVQYVKRVEHASGLRHVVLRDLTMVNSGHVHRPHGHVAESYVHANNGLSHRYGKSVCGTDEDWRAGIVHICGQLANRQFVPVVEPPRNLTNGNLWPQRPDADALLIHFYWRSWEEMVEKFTTGRGSFHSGDIKLRSKEVWNMKQMDRKYVQIDGRPGVMRYTFFRDFWRRVRTEARDRVRECVVTSVVDGRRMTRVVSLDVEIDD